MSTPDRFAISPAVMFPKLPLGVEKTAGLRRAAPDANPYANALWYEIRPTGPTTKPTQANAALARADGV